MVFGLPAKAGDEEVAACARPAGPPLRVPCRPIPLDAMATHGGGGRPWGPQGSWRVAPARVGIPTGTGASANGDDWRALSRDAQIAYANGFLAGAGVRRRPRPRRPTPAGLRQTMATLRQSGRFRFPYGANVYVARINDYYWWENHRPLPTWYAFWEVNTSLTGPTNEPAR